MTNPISTEISLTSTKRVIEIALSQLPNHFKTKIKTTIVNDYLFINEKFFFDIFFNIISSLAHELEGQIHIYTIESFDEQNIAIVMEYDKKIIIPKSKKENIHQIITDFDLPISIDIQSPNAIYLNVLREWY